MIIKKEIVDITMDTKDRRKNNHGILLNKQKNKQINKKANLYSLKFEHNMWNKTIPWKAHMPELTQEKINNLNRTLWNKIKKTESIIMIFKNQKALDSDGFKSEFHQLLKKEVLPLLYNLFQKTEAEEIFPNSSMRSVIPYKTWQRHYK